MDWTLKNELLYDAITRAAKNLQIASANFEKNYGGEKSSDTADNLLNAVREYEAAKNAFNK